MGRSLAVVFFVGLVLLSPLCAQEVVTPDGLDRLNARVVELYRQGEVEQALPLAERAVVITRNLYGDEHPDTATSLASLAVLYRLKGDYAQAEPLHRRALAIYEKALGPEHPDTATSLNDLAELYRARVVELYQQGQVEQALPLAERAVVINRRRSGEEHPDTATSLNDLAELYREKGDYALAEPLLKRALAIRERALGPEHPDTATNLNTLTGLYQAKGDYTQAEPLFKRVLAIREQHLGINLALGSERQKLAYAETLSWETSMLVSFHLQDVPKEANAAHLALTALLQRKGRVLEALASGQERLRRSIQPGDAKLLADWAALLTQYSTWVNRGPGELEPERYRVQLDEILSRKETLQQELSAHSAAFRVGQQAVTFEAVQKLLPEGAALVEYVQYRPVQPKAKGDRWGAPRYAVYLLRPSGAPVGIDLGEVEGVDGIKQQIERLGAALDRAPSGRGEVLRLQPPEREEVAKLAAALYGKLLAPLEAELDDVQQLLISPDGDLNRLPFAALRDPQGQFLIERYPQLTYLGSGRDLLRLQLHSAPIEPALLLAAPDYDHGGETRKVSLPASPRRSRDFGSAHFAPLPGTAQEAAALQALLNLSPDRVWEGPKAAEGPLKTIRGPKFLHLATHGFFLPEETEDPSRHPASTLMGTDTPPPYAQRGSDAALRPGARRGQPPPGLGHGRWDPDRFRGRGVRSPRHGPGRPLGL